MSAATLDRVRPGPGRPCTVCEHPDRDAIDDDIRCGRRYRAIASRYGLASHENVRRHAHSHLTPIPAPPSAPPITDPSWLASELHSLNERLHRWVDAFEDAGKPNEALKAASEIRKVLELVGRISGQIDDRIVIIQAAQVDLVGRVLDRTLDELLADVAADVPPDELRRRLPDYQRTAIDTIAQEAR